jgi:2-keto-3-deoxy-L-fuconate dehydrogenase|tara:strand:- start:750 stop:1514 length:765 start_codon:yes stop_codon:yes gene_type:complete
MATSLFACWNNSNKLVMLTSYFIGGHMARIGDSLEGKRVLITQSNEFMGPILCKVFEEHGAIVIADPRPMADPNIAEQVISDAGDVDVLIANLAVPAPSTPAEQVTDEEWQTVFSHIVDPMPRLMRALLPMMKAKGAGKVVFMGSASAMRGMKRFSTYSAARGAQVSYVRAVGVEVAKDNIQVNLIAQNFVDNPTYFPPEVQELEAFQARLAREVPIGRLATPEEDALFAVFLASSEVNFFVGQSIAFAGGWIN